MQEEETKKIINRLMYAINRLEGEQRQLIELLKENNTIDIGYNSGFISYIAINKHMLKVFDFLYKKENMNIEEWEIILDLMECQNDAEILDKSLEEIINEREGLKKYFNKAVFYILYIPKVFTALDFKKGVNWQYDFIRDTYYKPDDEAFIKMPYKVSKKYSSSIIERTLVNNSNLDKNMFYEEELKADIDLTYRLNTDPDFNFNLTTIVEYALKSQPIKRLMRLGVGIVVNNWLIIDDNYGVPLEQEKPLNLIDGYLEEDFKEDVEKCLKMYCYNEDDYDYSSYNDFFETYTYSNKELKFITDCIIRKKEIELQRKIDKLEFRLDVNTKQKKSFFG